MLLKKHRSRTRRPSEPVEQRPIFRDPRNFSLVVETYQNVVFRYVYNMVHDYHLAEDLTQEIFAKVYRSLPSYNARYPFSAWLLRIAHNHGIDHLRQRKLQTVSYDSISNDESLTGAARHLQSAASPTSDEHAQRVVIQEAIYSLSVDYRSVIVLRYLDGVKLEEIAYILAIPIGTVKSRINRARQILQHLLDQSRPAARRG
jgi:RNA polymerase sigma-70 factor (ECF subfamily)